MLLGKMPLVIYPLRQCGNGIPRALHLCGFVGLPRDQQPDKGAALLESDTMVMRGHMRFVMCMCLAALGRTAATTEMRMMMLCLLPVLTAVKQVALPQSTPPMAELQLRRLQTNTFTDTASLRTAVLARDALHASYGPNLVEGSAAYGPTSGWDVSAITSMYQLFKDLTAFNADISGWDTSGVTDMSQMFLVFIAHPLPLVSSRVLLHPALCRTSQALPSPTRISLSE